MSYFRFLNTYRTLLAFGLVTALSSSFGQTFFISLFLPYFLQDFALTKGDFGLLYAGGTLASALSLPYLGSLIDSLDLKRYISYTVLGMAVSAFIVAGAPHVAALAVGIVGLRLTGQGLLGHISQTVMAREFGPSRGKALGFASLGYPLGEALLPLVCAAALGFLPWKLIWGLVGVGALLVVLPLSLTLWSRRPAETEISALPAGAGPATIERGSFFRDPRTWLTLPALITPPFVLTGLFLFQAPLSEAKGWSLEWMAMAFTGFAITRAACSIGMGSLIDRYTATALLPIYTLPLGAAVLLVRFAESPIMAFPYLMLTGVTAGATGSIVPALWAEMFGVENVGRVRSFGAAAAVFSTAAAPALMGVLFNRGVGFGDMLLGGAAFIGATSALALVHTLRESERWAGLGSRLRLVRSTIR
ncbi:MAG: MFS transporter [Acidobacteria bacterium]|nr:MFS transporter [Acidobacteriota bacterium]